MNQRIELYLLKLSGQPKVLTIDRKGVFMGIIGIKLSGCAFTASIAKIVRRYRDISISEVKRIVLSNDYLISARVQCPKCNQGHQFEGIKGDFSK